MTEPDATVVEDQSDKQSGSRVYWAKEKDAEDVAEKCFGFISTWKRATGSNTQGLAATWARNVLSYYSCMLEPQSWESALQYTGEQGELVKMCVPQARSLVRQTVSLVSKQRQSYQCVAGQGATDSETLAAVRIGNGLCEYIVDEQHLDIKGEIMAEHVGVLGSGFLKASWRTDKGQPHMAHPDGESLMYTGDIEITVPTVYDVVYDTNKRFFEDLDWVLVRTTKNRWNLAAQHSDLYDEIMALPNAFDTDADTSNFFLTGGDNDDVVYVWELYHVPCPALPQGRMTFFASVECILHDGVNIYGCLPIEQIRAEPVMGTGFGYPIICNLLPAQEMLDHCLSSIATNQSATAVQSYIAPRGCELTAVDISGMNFLLYTPQGASGGGKPEALQLTQSAPETFKFAEVLHQHMEQISNINGALRGTPPPGVTAGKALNALTMNSIEFLESFRKNYAYGCERMMSKCIQFYKQFAQVPMMIDIMGPNSKSQIVEFVGKDLAPLKRVRIKQQSAILTTMGGRADVADTLLNSGMLKSPQQYISLVEGAPLEELVQDELSENDLLQREREMLLQGKEPPINEAHNHPNHVRDHGGLYNDPLVTGNPQLQAIIDEHINTHIQLEQSMDPFKKAMLRTGIAPQLPPPGPPGGIGGAPPPPSGPGPGGPPPGPPPPGQHGGPPPPGNRPHPGGMMHVPNPNIMLQAANPQMIDPTNQLRK